MPPRSWLRARCGLMIRPAAKAPTRRVTRTWTEVGVDRHLGEDRAVREHRPRRASAGSRAPRAGALDLGEAGAGKDVGVGLAAARIAAMVEAAVAGLDAGVAGAEERRVRVGGGERGEAGDGVAAGGEERAARGRGMARAAGDAGVGMVGVAGAELDRARPAGRARRRAICASAVQAPWPMSAAEVSTRPVPSARSMARASAWNIGAGKSALPMPQPTSRPAASRICRGASGRPVPAEAVGRASA